jgi:tRNA(Arg) A34 adenosine deaminase TadA
MDEFINAALEEARTGAAEGGIPIGAALVDGNHLVATGRNRRLQDSASIMHAEINCLYNASREGVQSFRGRYDDVLHADALPYVRGSDRAVRHNQSCRR